MFQRGRRGEEIRSKGRGESGDHRESLVPKVVGDEGEEGTYREKVGVVDVLERSSIVVVVEVLRALRA